MLAPGGHKWGTQISTNTNTKTNIRTVKRMVLPPNDREMGRCKETKLRRGAEHNSETLPVMKSKRQSKNDTRVSTS